MDNQQERLEIQKSWFAGFFEAEGWICLMKVKQKYKGEMVDRYVPVSGICNTDFTILEKCKTLLDEFNIGYHLAFQNPRKKGYKKLWQMNFSGLKRCSQLLSWILPYMWGDKTERGQKVLEFCEMRKEKTKGFNGVSYSIEDLKLYNDVLLKSPTTRRQALLRDDIV